MELFNIIVLTLSLYHIESKNTMGDCDKRMNIHFNILKRFLKDLTKADFFL